MSVGLSLAHSSFAVTTLCMSLPLELADSSLASRAAVPAEKKGKKIMLMHNHGRGFMVMLWSVVKSSMRVYTGGGWVERERSVVYPTPERDGECVCTGARCMRALSVHPLSVGPRCCAARSTLRHNSNILPRGAFSFEPPPRRPAFVRHPSLLRETHPNALTPRGWYKAHCRGCYCAGVSSSLLGYTRN